MKRILALLPDDAFARLRLSLGVGANIVRVRSASQLRKQLALGADLLILDPAQSPQEIDAFRELGRSLPQGKLVLYTSLRPDSVRAMLTMALGGSPPLLIGGVDDSPVHLRSLVADVALRFEAERFAAELARALGLSRNVAAVIRAALLQVEDCRTVARLASLVHISERSLNRWLRRSGLPPARLLLSFLRVAAAREWILNPALPLAIVSERLSFRSPRTLNRHVRRLTGFPPSYWRKTGSLEEFLRSLGCGLRAAAQP